MSGLEPARYTNVMISHKSRIVEPWGMISQHKVQGLGWNANLFICEQEQRTQSQVIQRLDEV